MIFCKYCNKFYCLKKILYESVGVCKMVVSKICVYFIRRKFLHEEFYTCCSCLVYTCCPYEPFLIYGNWQFNISKIKCKNLDSILIFEFPSHAMIQNVQIHFAWLSNFQTEPCIYHSFQLPSRSSSKDFFFN